MGEKITFFKNFIKNPRKIGSIIPSSNTLANKMVEQQDLKTAKSIVELGAGVGCFTSKIMERKNEDTPFYVFEQNEDMKKILKNKFPSLIIYDNANDLSKYVKNNKIKMPDTIISGLPFTSLDKELRYSILEQVHDCLDVGGKFITFQYSLHLLKYLKGKYDKVEIKVVPLNIPMAYIYVCTK